MGKLWEQEANLFISGQTINLTIDENICNTVVIQF